MIETKFRHLYFNNGVVLQELSSYAKCSPLTHKRVEVKKRSELHVLFQSPFLTHVLNV